MIIISSWTAGLATYLGTQESGLKIVLGQLAGYPLLLLYRRCLSSKDTNLQHMYFFLTGFLLSLWVIGEGVTHSLFSILATYIIILVAGGSLASVGVSFTFNMSYLLTGYWFIAKDNYEIDWTMPHCVLCLRLIGLTWDVYDGARQMKDPNCLTKDQARTALATSPSILEMMSHSFFIGGYFVGPQFSLTKYRLLVTPEYQANLPASPVQFGLGRLAMSICYMTLHIFGSSYLPEFWPVSEEFVSTPLLLRLVLLPVWCKLILAKYLAMWLMAEGVCAISGLSYVGLEDTPNGPKPDWKGCANVKLRRLESATKFGHYVESFNMNTNSWAMNYVYKRLRFLNNKYVSQLAALLFLAAWHGFHSGYYLTFFNEFLVINFEREFSSIWSKSSKVARWKEHWAFVRSTTVLGWVYVHFFLPHCFIPFQLLSANRYMPVYASLFYLQYVFFLGWLGWGKLVKVWLISENVEKKKEE